MKFVTALLVLGLLSPSVFGAAQEPVPFKALMQPAATYQSVPPTGNQSAQSPAQTAPVAHTSHRGKVFIGTGIGMVALGGGVLALTGISWGSSSKKDAGYAAGGGLAGVGVALIVIGVHRRSAQRAGHD